MKKLHQQPNKDVRTVNDLIALFNDFVALNGGITETVDAFKSYNGYIYPSADIRNHQYLRGIWALFYLLSTDLSEVVYTEITDKGMAIIKPVTDITKIYNLCKTIL